MDFNTCAYVWFALDRIAVPLKMVKIYEFFSVPKLVFK